MAVLLGFLASLKLFFLLFLLLFLNKKYWRNSITFTLSFFAFSFLPLTFIPWHEYQNFFQLANDPLSLSRRVIFTTNGSLMGFIATLNKLFTLTFTWTTIKSITATCSFIIITGLLIFYLNTGLKRLTAFRFEISFSLLILFCLILSPLGWIYYYPLLLIPIVIFYKVARRCYLSTLFFPCLLAALLLPCFAWLDASTPLTYSLKSLAAFSSLLAWLACLLLIIQAIQQTKLPRTNQLRCYHLCLIGSTLVSISLLATNFGFPFYFSPKIHQQTLKQKPYYWIVTSSKIATKRATSSKEPINEITR